MEDISMLLAFSAGLLSFLSPCVLPMLPAYISYLTGSSIKELKEEETKLFTVYKSIGFVLGFSIVFILMGASVTSIGKLFISHRELLRNIGGVLIIIFGIHTMGILKLNFLYHEKRLMQFHKIQGSFSSILLGMAFAAGWTPCIGPILSSILIYATSTNSVGKGVMLLAMYSLGLAVPFLMTAITLGSIGKYLKKFSMYYQVISIISGALLVILGVLIFTNKLAILSQYFNFINL